MRDTIHASITDKAYLISVCVGGCIGLSAFLFSGIVERPPGLIDPAKLQLSVSLLLALFAGLLAAIVARKQFSVRLHTLGSAGRLGIRAGLTCSVLAGGVLTLMATLDTVEAGTASSDRIMRTRMWLVLAVSTASILPGVLCGLVGGLIGGRTIVAHWSDAKPVDNAKVIPWLRWAHLGIAGTAVFALASPFGLFVKAPVVDAPPIVELPPPTPEPPPPPPFRYEPPADIKLAGVGEIQPSFAKVIPDVQSSVPISMSPDGVLVAFGDSSQPRTTIGIFDLHRFSKVASIAVPALPHSALAWSPDQKSIACTIGEGQARRICILRIDSRLVIELPRPPGRDIPGGELFWWQENELVFFPSDEAPLSFDLQNLTLTPLDQSSHFSKLVMASKQRWRHGARNELPSQPGWKLGLRTLIRSAIPPSSHDLNAAWQFSGETICAMINPELPFAFGFKSLGVLERSRLLCAPDGSKIARLMEGGIEVTYMRKAQAPQFFLEVDMPVSIVEVEGADWGQTLKSKELCLLLCAPLQNPLNNRTVGPDYGRIRGLAQLVRWAERKAVFMVQTHDDSIRPGDVATVPHFWKSGMMSEWNPSVTRQWWSLFTLMSDTQPESLPEIESPRLHRLIAEPAFLLVEKAPAEPHPETPTRDPDSYTVAPPRSLGEVEVRAFLVEHHAKASRGDVVGMMANYDQMVDFLDKGRIPQAPIVADGMAYRQKWPQCSEEIMGEIRLEKSADGIWRAYYTIRFHNENGSGEWHKGKADLSMILRVNGQRLVITSQKARVYEVTDSRATSQTTPGKAPVPQQKGVPITVPKPCYVAMMRANDLPQIEITDQISFINGLKWHRTYREVLKDGKILHTCRAIYEGSVQISADKRSVQAYLKSQGWEQNLGANTFVRTCERSARSLVGNTYKLQLTPNGMVESTTGRSFQLQK